MISYLSGKVKFKKVIPKKESTLVVDVGGVGYKVGTLDRIASSLKSGDEVDLFIYTQVAESVLALYGFVTEEELEFFEVLISISGIGPKSALDILNKAKIEDLKQAAKTGSHEILNKMSGIGPKKAEKIVLGLKDKIGSLDSGSEEWNDDFSEALEALVALGYSAGQVREALSRCESTDTGEKVKEALRLLGR
jgi:holliday junction DNA helicase RuvA